MGGERLTERDTELLWWHSRLTYLSTSLIAAFFFGNKPKVARRRLRILASRGYLSYFEAITHCQQGRPERIWHLSKKRKSELVSLLGRDRLSFYKSPQNVLFVQHHLKICELILCLKKCCDASKEYSFDFFIENENGMLRRKKEDEVLPVIRKDKANFLPDFLIILRSSYGASLFFGEVDMASQTLSAASKNKKDVSNKIRAYMNYLSTQEYLLLSEKFSYNFKGFRLLFVTISQTRLRNLIELCEVVQTRGIVWITTFSEINPMTILSCQIWHVPCSKKEGLQSILKKHLQEDGCGKERARTV